MPHDPERHRRRTVRLPDHDYSAGAYFLTLCTHERTILFGDIIGGLMTPNDLGEIVVEEWHRSATIRAEIDLFAFILMPNHIHGIIILNPDTHSFVGAHGRAPASQGGVTRSTTPQSTNDTPRYDVVGDRAHGCAPLQRPPQTVGAFVAGFKAATTRRINQMRDLPGTPVWQRNYYEHLIRDDAAMARIYNYIATNPFRWHLDVDNPHRLGVDLLEEWITPATSQAPDTSFQ